MFTSFFPQNTSKILESLDQFFFVCIGSNALAGIKMKAGKLVNYKVEITKKRFARTVTVRSEGCSTVSTLHLKS